jgi:hypothetical protein
MAKIDIPRMGSSLAGERGFQRAKLVDWGVFFECPNAVEWLDGSRFESKLTATIRKALRHYSQVLS